MASWLAKWGNCWALELAPGGRDAVDIEPGRGYLLVLTRQPGPAKADETAIRPRPLQLGSDLGCCQAYPNGPAVPAA